MTLNNALRMNEHLDLDLVKHADRLYVQTLVASQPQFSSANLIAEVRAETEYWMQYLSSASPTMFLQSLTNVQHIFDALNHESNALKDVENAIVAHGKREWSEASVLYANAASDLHSAISDWQFAMHEVADDSPFDVYYPTQAQRKKRGIEDPPRASFEEMSEISTSLFRLYRNLDRVFCICQELTQRQISCLMQYMQAAEEQNALLSSRSDTRETPNSETC